jgi:proteasome assembly chaperone (PAC2) family protein
MKSAMQPVCLMGETWGHMFPHRSSSASCATSQGERLGSVTISLTYVSASVKKAK